MMKYKLANNVMNTSLTSKSKFSTRTNNKDSYSMISGMIDNN